MTIRCWRATVAAALLFGALAPRAVGQVSERLSVAGAVETPLALGVDDLKGFPAADIQTVSVTRRVDDRPTTSVVRGVLLTAVLKRAGLAGSDHNDWKRTVVLATATDGYQVVFSWPELANTEVGAGVLVVFERDGQPLADREGRIALVSARDTKPGPRSVRSLTRLSVSIVEK